MKRYALKGINDDAQTCTICGKVELKRVMWLVELGSEGDEISEPFHCGTTCGARMLGYTQSKIATKCKNYRGDVARLRGIIERNHPATIRGWELCEELNHLGLYGKARFEHPLSAEMHELFREARLYSLAQEVLVEL